MDEIDWIKSIKKILLIIGITFGAIGIFFAIVALLQSSTNEWEYTKGLLFVALSIGIGVPTIIGICYLIMILFFKILNSGNTEITFDKEYIRDFPKHCSPAISSLVYDLKIDVYKDYTATILYLCTKKYIHLVKNADSYELKILEHPDYSNLGRCEKYVLDILQNKVKFDENQFKNEIIKEAQEKRLITDKKLSKKAKIALILIFIVLSLIVTYNISKMVFMILISIFGAILYTGCFMLKMKNENQINFDFVDTQYIRTKDGKNIALLLKGLKRFIKEYTLINEKEIDYIQILEDYIPYALALDEADTVEEFIKYNEEYRNLIYNRENIT